MPHMQCYVYLVTQHFHGASLRFFENSLMFPFASVTILSVTILSYYSLQHFHLSPTPRDENDNKWTFLVFFLFPASYELPSTLRLIFSWGSKELCKYGDSFKTNEKTNSDTCK